MTLMRTHLRSHLFCALVLVATGVVFAQQPQPTAADIMTRVARHQDESEAQRVHYVYVQHTKTSSRKGKTIMCEETTDYRITPTPESTHAELIKVDGRVLIDHNYVQYSTLMPSGDDNKPSDESKDQNKNKESDPTNKPDTDSPAKDHAEAMNETKPKADAPKPPPDPAGDGIDRNIVEHMRESLFDDKSKDGINARLFPLTSKGQANYLFTLTGREHLNNRDVYHVKFRPKDKKDYGWEGDAYIDVDAYQPVLVTTGMSRKVPFAVRTFLGINVPGLGFTIIYAPQPDGTWFPVSLSTEFKMDVLFFFRRDFIMNAQNRDFEKTHGEARILDGATPVEPAQP